MLGFINKLYIVVTGLIGLHLVNPLKCVSISNQQCKVRILIVASLHFILTEF